MSKEGLPRSAESFFDTDMVGETIKSISFPCTDGEDERDVLQITLENDTVVEFIVQRRDNSKGSGIAVYPTQMKRVAVDIVDN